MLLLISDANILIDMEAGELMQGKYGTAPSPNDYLALALAKQEGCPLLTGDQDLKAAAQAEDVPVNGTVWLLQMMVENHLLSVDEAITALTLMKESKRRLPWADAERILNGLRQDVQDVQKTSKCERRFD